jgi:NADH dehydrogenase
LIGFDNKILVLFQWAWNYFTHKRGAILVTNEARATLIKNSKEQEAVASPILEAEVRR